MNLSIATKLLGCALLASMAAQSRAEGEDSALVLSTLLRHPCGAITASYDPQSDRVLLVEALRAGRFAALERVLREANASAHAAGCSDRPLGVAIRAFDDADPSLDARYAQWITARPRSPWPRALRGRYYLSRGGIARGAKVMSATADERIDAMHAEYARAATDLDAALALDPTVVVAATARLDVLRQEGTQAESRAAYEQFLQSNPDSYMLRVGLLATLVPIWGGSMQELERFASETPSREALARNPDLAMFQSYGACVISAQLRRDGRRADAEAIEADARKRFADALEPWCYSSGHLASGNPIAPTTSSQKAAELDAKLSVQQGSAELFCDRASLSYDDKHFDDARELVARGTALRAAEPNCVREQARLSRLPKLGVARPSIDLFREAVSESRNDARLRFEFGLALLSEHRYDQADVQLSAVIDLKPKYPWAWYRRGISRANMRQAALAISDFDRAIELDPSQRDFWSWRGTTKFWQLSDNKGATADLREAVRLGADDAPTFAALGQLYRIAHDCEAVATLRRLAEICKSGCDPSISDYAPDELGSDVLHDECPSQFDEARSEPDNKSK